MGLYILCLVLFCLGIYCAVAKRNMIKILIGITIAELAANLFLVLMCYKDKCLAPILDPENRVPISQMVDPLPQALVLTSIVIGLATTALMVALAMRIYQKYRTYDIGEIRELKG